MKYGHEEFRQRVISYLAGLGAEEMALVSRAVNEERTAREIKAKPRERGSLMIVLKEGHEGLRTEGTRAHVRNVLVSTNVADTETADAIIKNRWPVLEHLTEADASDALTKLNHAWNPTRPSSFGFSWAPERFSDTAGPFKIVPQVY